MFLGVRTIRWSEKLRASAASIFHAWFSSFRGMHCAGSELPGFGSRRRVVLIGVLT
jgi:hypothetical protein